MKVLCILLCVAFTSGLYIDNNETHEEKIFGGDDVRIENVPYQASLLSLRLNIFCGAAIIDKSWVITASHCLEHRSHITIGTGSGHSTFSKVHTIEKIIMHEDYDKNSDNNDIALIKLARPIQFNNKQHPVEIAKPYDIPREGELMRISGFGKIEEHLGYSDILKAAYLPVINQEYCKRVYSLHDVTDNMFCAGNGSADACKGDSGGPGVIHGKLYGIISNGPECGSRNVPGVYTRVCKYYHWIKEKTGLSF